MSEGIFYAFRADGIYVHDDDIEIFFWKMLYLFQYPLLLRDRRHFVAVGDEILTLNDEEVRTYDSCFSLHQTKGFANTTKDLACETAKIPVSRDSRYSLRFMGTMDR